MVVAVGVTITDVSPIAPICGETIEYHAPLPLPLSRLEATELIVPGCPTSRF